MISAPIRTLFLGFAFSGMVFVAVNEEFYAPEPITKRICSSVGSTVKSVGAQALFVKPEEVTMTAVINQGPLANGGTRCSATLTADSKFLGAALSYQVVYWVQRADSGELYVTVYERNRR